MRKFLAVLLAVAILGVASAAFAVEAGHVTPGKSSTGKKVIVNAEGVKQHVTVTKELKNSVEGVTAKELAADEQSKDIEAKAKEGYIVAAFAPALKVTEAVAEASMDVKFDAAYVGEKISADLGFKAATENNVALAGGTTFKFMSGDKSVDVVPASKELTLVISSLEKGSYTPMVTIAATKAISGVTEESGIDATIYDEISKDFGPFTEVTLKTKSVTSPDKKATLTFEDFTVAAPGSYASKVVDFTTFANAAKSGAALSVDIDGSYVTLAAGATFEKAAVYSETSGKKTSTVFSGNGYVAYKVSAVTDATAKHTMAVVADAKEEEPSGKKDPTSSKGSGGCNGGFAGIAVLALGLAALRRKAR